MDWKSELIETEAQAVAFLTRELAAMGLPGFKVERYGGPRCLSHSGLPQSSFKAVIKDPQWLRNKKYEDTFLDFLVAKTSATEAAFHYLAVDDRIERRGLGDKAVKSMLAIAAEWGVSSIQIRKVSMVGPVYWARRAAVPVTPPQNLSYLVRHQAERSFALSGRDREQLNLVATMPEHQCYQAWRRFALAELSGDGCLFRKTLLCQYWADHDYCIIPSDRGSRDILEAKLGLLPPFRRPEPVFASARVARALTLSP